MNPPSSERKKFWTRTNQAFFSSRRALLIQWVVKVPFFRFGGIPDWLGWRSLGEWSGHWPAFPMLARREVTTLAACAYLLRASWPFGRCVMRIACDLLMSIWSALNGSMLGVRFGRQQVLFPWTKGFLFWCSTKDFGIRRGAEHRGRARPDDDTGSDHSYRNESTLDKAWLIAG